MRLRPLTWFLLSLMFFVAGACFWHWGNLHQARQGTPAPTPASQFTNQPPSKSAAATASRPFDLLSLRAARPSGQHSAHPNSPTTNASTNRHPYRVSNTHQSIDDLVRDETAILLRNALVDTSSKTALPVPDHLRSAGDPGSYVVQARGRIDDSFRIQLRDSGATIVSYIPNNAYLVRLPAAAVRRLAAKSRILAILPYEPFYKLDERLLAVAAKQQTLPANTWLNVTVFPDALAGARKALADLGATVIAQSHSPFGPQLILEPKPDTLVALARLPEIQGLETFRRRVALSDLTRERLAITGDPVTETNYLGLTGANVVINLNDTGVDASHPDLAGQVITTLPAATTDLNGHGTHVAGIMVGTGANSTNLPVAGSAAGASFRGLAPGAKVFTLPVDLTTGPPITDAELQETAATHYFFKLNRTNAQVSNNSWAYAGLNEYNLSAASFDAAVRDALPESPGSQPVLYVFGSGNDGFGRDEGTGGVPDSILSPATAKNVITVGALENFRSLTNQVSTTNVTTDATGNSITNISTNQVFFATTDSNNEVADFSSRGNVGIGLEGSAGRFKPDVVAPGTFVVSTRSKDWNDPTSFTNIQVNTIPDQELEPGDALDSAIFVPDDASGLTIRAVPNAKSPRPFPGLNIFARLGAPPVAGDLLGANQVSLPPARPLSPGFWYYRITNPNSLVVNYDLEVIITRTNIDADYFGELKKLNDGLQPHYRFESGTSIAAPAVSGLLALLQQFFEDGRCRGAVYSPALLKALLINGARPAGPLYDLQVNSVINFQGWGVPNLTNALPLFYGPRFSCPPAGGGGSGASAPIPHAFRDQSLTRALAVGQQNSWKLTPTSEGQQFPLRVTLVWTDPPGNPNAAVKLVNDLDLILTNLDSGEVYYGNNIPSGSDYTQASSTNALPANDPINNVENVFINAPLGSNFTITVYARRVNVNAVTEQFPTAVVQDYALVISTENTVLTNAFVIEDLPVAPVTVAPAVAKMITNALPLLNERVGANPQLGSTNGLVAQWNFYVFTNDFDATNSLSITNGTNVAFVTFLPPNLARPRLEEADIDLYVSSDPGLLRLEPAAIANAFKATTRGGTEVITFTDSVDDQVYYVGVKSEDQQGGEFGLVGLSSNLPFEEDVNGNRLVRGLPFNVPIPDGSPEKPGAALMFAIAIRPIQVQSVIVTNVITHQNFGDLLGNLSHNRQFSVLNNHRLVDFSGTYTFIYDEQQRAFNSSPTDGPGSLSNFVGEEGQGLWLLTMVDNSLNHIGAVNLLQLFLEPVSTNLNGIAGSVNPNEFAYFTAEVPIDATNLTATLSSLDPSLPLDLYLRRDAQPTQTDYDKFALITPPGGSLSLTINDIPPLNAGRYYVGVYNPNSVVVNFILNISINRSLTLDLSEQFTSTNTPSPLLDDALTMSLINVGTDREITDVKVGVRIDHPRISDLVLHLGSPQGTRVLLAENRGGAATNGFGSGGGGETGIAFAGFTENTDLSTGLIKFTPPPYSTPITVSNVPISGFEGWPMAAYNTGQFVDGWQVLTNQVRVITTNLAHTGTNVLSLQRGRINRVLPTVAGQQYTLSFAYRASTGGVINAQVIMDGVLKRFITASATSWQILTIAFTAVKNGTELEFAPAFNRVGMLLDSFEMTDPRSIIYFTPEESLDLFKGERGLGDWGLEIWDNRAGPSQTLESSLVRWELDLSFATPTLPAVRLTNGICYSATIEADEIEYFIVEVPRSASFATNALSGAGDLVLLFNQNGAPTGNNLGDVIIDDLGPNEGEYLLLDKNAAIPPALQPGQRYYLAVQNFDQNETNSFTICVNFDRLDGLTILTNGIFFTTNIAVTRTLDYYGFNVSSNAASVTFELVPTNGNANLVVRRDLPLPTALYFDYESQNLGTNADLIVLHARSTPVPLGPGWWYLGVWNADTNAVGYSIRATESTNTGYRLIRLQDGVPVTGGLGTNDMVTNYYVFSITNAAASAARFELSDLTGNADLYLQWLTVPDTFGYYKRSTVPGVYPEVIVIRTNLAQPAITGDWYLQVVNVDLTNVNYTIKASLLVGTNIITLTNGVVFTNTVDANLAGFLPQETDYYRFTVASNQFADFTLRPVNGNVDLSLRKGLPPANPRLFDYHSTNLLVTPEFIRLKYNTPPVQLSPGVWHLAVYNQTNFPSFPVAYTIQALEYYASVQPLTNAAPFTNTIRAGRLLDYYQVNVSSNATSLVCEILTTTGDVGLGLRLGLPLFDPQEFHHNSTRTARNLVITTNSAPVALTPGAWYLTVTNRSDTPATYTVRVTEIFGAGVPSTNVVISGSQISNGQFCLTWSSTLGNTYTVQGRTNITDPGWDVLSPTITATAATASFCIPLSDPHRFFRVVEGNAPATAIAPTLAASRATTNTVVLRWTAPASQQFQVQFTPSLVPVITWQTLTNVITAADGNFSFTDDGSQTGGAAGERYYRVKRFP